MSAFISGSFNSAEGNTGGAATAALAYSASPTSGNLLIVATSVFNVGGTTAISDSQTNTWTRINASQIKLNSTIVTAWWAIAKNSSAVTVTITFAATSQDYGLAVHEYSLPVATPNDAATSSTGTSTALSSGSATSTAVGDIWFAASSDGGTVTFTGPPYSQTASWTDRSTQTATTHMPLLTADFGVGASTATGAQHGDTWTANASADWAGLVGCFKMSAGGTVTPEYRLLMLGVT